MAKVTKERIESDKMPVFRKRFKEIVDGEGGISKFSDFTKDIEKSFGIYPGHEGFSRQSIGYWYNGPRVPDAESLLRLSRICKKSVDWLLGRIDHDIKSSDPDIMKMCVSTGLSSEAIERLIMIQTDSGNHIAQSLRQHERRYTHMLSWLIVNQGHHIDENTGECFFDGLLDYLNMNPGANITLHTLTPEDVLNGDFKFLGQYSSNELFASQGRSMIHINEKTIEAGTFDLIQERLRTLRRVYWNQIYEELGKENDSDL